MQLANLLNDRVQPLAIQTYIQMAQQKGIISFAAGLPDLSVQPIAQLKAAYQQVGDLHSSSFQYQAPSAALKQKIQALMANQSVDCGLDEILITNGAQQALYLTAQLLFNHSKPLMIESLVYPGFLQITNLMNLQYLVLQSSFDTGLNLNQLESVLKSGKTLPFLYVICNGHNPLGITLDQQFRKELVYLAEKFDVILIEDDPYGLLSFTDQKMLPLRAYTKNAMYIGSFSKIIAPAVRTGWVVADPLIIHKMQQLKDLNDLSVVNPNHLALNYLLEHYHLDDIIRGQTLCYQQKLQCMIATLTEYLEVPFQYTVPMHGMFLWLEFPNSNLNLCHDQIIAESKVLYIPSTAFAIDPANTNPGIRLNFSYPSQTEIVKGIKQLCQTINKTLKVSPITAVA